MIASRFYSFLSVLLLAGASLFAAGLSAQGAPGKFTEVKPPQPTEPGKVEVLEFFSYGCPHCAVLEPMVSEWAKKQPPDVVVRHVPVAFNAGMKPLQQLYYSLESLNRQDLHPKVFAAIHQEKKKIFTKPAIVDWVASQGVDRAKFESMFDSFGVQSKIQRANQLVQSYKIDGTPTLAVGGQFLTSPSTAGGYQESVIEADALVKSVQASRK